MKRFLKSLTLVAISATAFIGCNKSEIDSPIDNNKSTVRFAAEIAPVTKATLDADAADATFTAAWVDEDEIGIYCSFEDLSEDNVYGMWSSDDNAFLADLEVYNGAEASFVGVYPYSENSIIDFGAARKQNGNAYNSLYDVMVSNTATTTISEGTAVKLNMNRLTAIQYFHFTGKSADLTVKSATLTVATGDIAGSFSYANGLVTPTADGKTITITYENGKAPTADDIQLWYNVMPGTVSGLSLVVTLSDDSTISLSNSKETTFVAGNLYKVKKHFMEGAGTVDNPYSVADALYLAGNLEDAALSPEDVYVAGKIIDLESYSDKYGSINYFIGTESSSLYVFGGYDFNKTKFSGLEDLAIGQDVVVCGKLKKFVTEEETTLEIYSNNHICSINGYDYILKGISISSGDASIFNAGETFQKATVKATYRGKDDADVTSSAEFSGYDMNSIGTQSVTVTYTENGITKTGSYTITVNDPNKKGWLKTSFSDLKAGDQVVIVSSGDGGVFAMSNDNGTAAAPKAVSVKIADDMLSNTPSTNIVWVVGEGGTKFLSYEDNEKYLYCTNTNNGVRVGTGENATFSYSDGYLLNIGQKRYLGVYTTAPDWRCYTSTTTNISGQETSFYVNRGGADPIETEKPSYNVIIDGNIQGGTVEADIESAVEGTVINLTATPADGYEFTSWNVTYGSNTITVNNNKFTMPAANVNVSAQFSLVQGGGEEGGDDANTGTIKFGTNDVKINAASVTGDDSLGNTWTITTVGTTSFTTNAAYYQVGSSSKPASSITFTTTLPESVEITSMSAKFGGFSGTAGSVTMKVGDTSIGTGSLNATDDVTVNSSSTASGTILTVTVTGIAKGVKVYNISYTYSSGNDDEGND